MTAPATVRTCLVPAPTEVGHCGRESADGRPICVDHAEQLELLTHVAETRVEQARHLADAARSIRLAMATGRALGDVDSDWVSWPDLDRALGQALTGVHAAKHLTPEPAPFPDWVVAFCTT